jgi:hypothetical protein
MRYFLGFLIMLGLVFVGILLLVRLFFGSPDQEQTAKAGLVENAGTTKTVQLTIDGPINANQVHKQVKIEVSNSQSRLELIDGYEGRATKTSLYENNTASYAEFLRALDLLGYTLGLDDKTLQDERGYCPTGQRYIFEIKDGTKTIQRYWSTSCNATKNFNGRTNEIVNLFRAQIPQYNEVARGYNL